MFLIKYKKKIVFSAIQPSGNATLGNYLGAIKNWRDMQDEYDCIFALADLHAITVRQKPKELKENVIRNYALFIACGIEPEKCNFFIQSHVTAHSQLAWILNCHTQIGELSRMTQFKDKSKQHTENINAGLFTYPCLMAADILLYDTNFVPVGRDQKQHVEIARNIAQRFNSTYGETFILPEPLIPKLGAKIMSLKNPEKKMSKSSLDEDSTIFILDKPDLIIKKIKRAVTDSESSVKFTENETTGINNLIVIYSCITNKTFLEIEIEFENKGYGFFKNKVAEAIIEKFSSIQKKFDLLIKDKDFLEKCQKESTRKASEKASITLSRIYEKIGL
ncbi:MAG: tryptophan--tRNA ligase [Oscillospiraceae bacterium]|nr:tryptophan--tRNA ligase [Oscillospiraceae bacterium]